MVMRLRGLLLTGALLFLTAAMSHAAGQSAASDGRSVPQTPHPATPAPTMVPATLSDSGGAPVEIDFTSVARLPDELRAPLAAAIESGGAILPPDRRLTMTAFRRADDWAYIALVPTHIIEVGWEVDWWPDEIVQALAGRDASGAWVVTLFGDARFAGVAARVPPDFMDFSPLPNVPLDGYAFPWPLGQTWLMTWGWHSGNAIDFQPIVRVDPAEDMAVLAAAPGRLTEICHDAVQSDLLIEHADGVTLYFHLDVETVPRDLLGQHVAQGQFLGVLYDGVYGEGWYNGWHYQYWSGCGSATGPHLHFALPRRDLLIDGFNANEVASAPRRTPYRSSNAPFDSGR